MHDKNCLTNTAQRKLKEVAPRVGKRKAEQRPALDAARKQLPHYCFEVDIFYHETS